MYFCYKTKAVTTQTMCITLANLTIVNQPSTV
jgi:hypothetical protein